MQGIKENPLGAAPVPRLMLKFAIPSIIAMLVGRSLHASQYSTHLDICSWHLMQLSE